jgi:hypothetical protein
MFRFQPQFSLSSRTRPAADRRRRSFCPEMGGLEKRESLSALPAGPQLYIGPPVPPKKPPIVAVSYPPNPCFQWAGPTGNIVRPAALFPPNPC